MTMLYLDHAATTPLRPEAAEAMAPYLGEMYGNPSGIHDVSRRAKNALEDARERIASILGAAAPLEVVFTGGGTESDNLGVKGPAFAGGRRGGIVTTEIEHEAVLASARFAHSVGCPLTIVGVEADGVVEPSRVAEAVGPDTAVVSVMAANNETGITQPIRKVVEEAKASNPDAVVHTDAVQAFVATEVTADGTGADLITLAGHKFGGPKGVGLLWVTEGSVLEPAVHGGGQELGRRSGTHNVAGIVGMAAAMEAAVADRAFFRDRVSQERDRFEAALVAAFPDIEFTGRLEDRLPQHSHFRIPGVSAETLLIRLDQAGVAAAAGSACHSGAVEVSHVLAAMGMEPQAAAEALRFSFGWTTRPGDGAEAATTIITEAQALR
jgi:cysteine desulfurase